MALTPSYPTNIKDFGPDKRNTVDLIDAVDPNSIRAEVVSIENTLGTTPAYSTSATTSGWSNSATDYTTVKARLANIEKGIVADTHTQYVKIAGGSTIQTSASTIGLIVKGAVSQSSNLQEWQDKDGTVLASIDASGNFTAVNVSGGGGSAGFEGNLLLGGM